MSRPDIHPTPVSSAIAALLAVGIPACAAEADSGTGPSFDNSDEDTAEPPPAPVNPPPETGTGGASTSGGDPSPEEPEEPEGSTGGFPPDCALITPPADFLPDETYSNVYLGFGDFGLGGPETDAVRLLFMVSDPGVHDLASGVNENYSTCEQCILVLGDIQNSGSPAFYPTAGTLEIPTGTDPTSGTFSATLQDVVLTEVTIGGEDVGYASTPVPGGACIRIADGTYSYGLDPGIPAGWGCSNSRYADGATCDCGCGVVDPDCADALEASCHACNDEGSCAVGLTDCESIADDNNAVCMPTGYVQDFELPDAPSEIAFAGDAPWELTTSDAQTGAQSLRAGLVTHNQASHASIQVDYTAPGTLMFWSRVSSETNFDFLELFIDDVSLGTWSGELDWTRRSFPVAPGTHEVRWSYIKDGSESRGDDTAWVDGISTVNGNIVNP